jgi:hypothetical protein
MSPATNWSPLFEAIEGAFDKLRPRRFTDRPYSQECAGVQEYFEAFDNQLDEAAATA